MRQHQIILVPRENFWEWVRAARAYILTFGPNITPDPHVAGRYMLPNQTVTIVLPPNGYPAYGDIRRWFQQHYPGVALDVIEVANPEELRQVLGQRIANLDRYGEASRPFRLLWPTDYPVITQPFGAHPEIYSRWGLPGHEGVDIRAPMNTNVYAAADGEVYLVDDDPAGAYGKQVRIRHRNGYRTVYAHLNKILVWKGQFVKAGERIALADSTGNSTGSHLHLTLKLDGATSRGETNYPSDIIDPTPFLVWPSDEERRRKALFHWPAEKCLIGAALRPDGQVSEADFKVVEQARLEAVRLLSSVSDEVVDHLRALNPNLFIMVTLAGDFSQGEVSPSVFVQQITADMARFYAKGVRYFEVHQQPNLQAQGWMRTWRDGLAFGEWFQAVVASLRQVFPEAQLGFPGLSPGGDVPGQRTDALRFLEQADEAVLAADWVGVHAFWRSQVEMGQTGGGQFYEVYRLRYPQKLAFITAFANINPATDFLVRGQQYLEYLRRLRSQWGVGAAFGLYTTPGSAATYLGWATNEGVLTPIVGYLGTRTF